MKTEKANSHAALFDKMEKVLWHLFSPNDAGLKFHLVARKVEFYFDPGVGGIDIRCPDEHTCMGDVLGKCHPVCLLNAKVHLETFFEPHNEPIIINHLDAPLYLDKLNRNVLAAG